MDEGAVVSPLKDFHMQRRRHASISHPFNEDFNFRHLIILEEFQRKSANGFERPRIHLREFLALVRVAIF